MKMNGQIKKSIVHSNWCEGTFVVLSMISILEKHDNDLAYSSGFIRFSSVDATKITNALTRSLY